MDKFVMEGSSRDTTSSGSSSTRRLRDEGHMPLNVYGGDKPNMNLTVNAGEFFKALENHHRFFEIKFEGQVESGILKEVQYDIYGDKAIHADLARVSADTEITTTMRILTSGVAKGVTGGGVMDMAYRHVPVRGKIGNLRDSLTINVESMGTNESIRARDLVMPEGVELLLSEGTPVIICHGRRGG